MPAPTPPLIPQPFADAGDRNTIPNTTPSLQRASYQLGYPPATMEPIDAGGTPMLGPDMNGILWDISSWSFAIQGGQIQPYSSDVSDAIGGYALGALVLMADGRGYWINGTDSNVTDPDTGGAGWQPLYAYGAADISGLVGGTRTLDAIEASRPFLLLSGTLLANQQVIVPSSYRNWLVINNCVLGSFTLTVKTAAGTGVAIPAGGAASPTAVWCNTLNVERVFVPSALPTSVAPTADSILLRDNLGRAFGLTAALGTATTELATTEFVNPGTSLGATGYEVLPSGRINQWGFHAFTNSPATITLPIPFPNGIFGVQLTPRAAGASLRDKTPTLGTLALSNFTMQDSDGSQGTYWFAYGW